MGDEFPVSHRKDEAIVRLLNGVSLLLREMADFARFFWRTPESEKAIVFYAEHGGYYPSFEGLIEKLLAEHNGTVCYVTSEPGDPILRESEPGIRSFYLKRLLPFFMALVNCRVFVMTLTDLNRYHLKRSVNPVHYVYVFHALVSTHMIYRYGAFDHYDSILCCGPHHVQEIRRHEELNQLPQKSLIEAGYFRLERIHQEYQRCFSEKPPSDASETVLIAPSWGVANILESCGERLVGFLLGAGYNVIVRPHPETTRRSPDLIASLCAKFDTYPGFTLETSIAGDDSLLRADVLISDYSGIALEYAFGTERPVLFLGVPAKVNNPRFDELGIEPLELHLRSEIGVVLSPEELESVPQVISDLIVNKGTYRKRIAQLRKQHVYASGRSSEIGAQHIMGLAQGKGVRASNAQG